MQSMNEMKFPIDPNDLTPDVFTAAMSLDRPGLIIEDLKVIEPIGRSVPDLHQDMPYCSSLSNELNRRSSWSPS